MLPQNRKRPVSPSVREGYRVPRPTWTGERAQNARAAPTPPKAQATLERWLVPPPAALPPPQPVAVGKPVAKSENLNGLVEATGRVVVDALGAGATRVEATVEGVSIVAERATQRARAVASSPSARRSPAAGTSERSDDAMLCVAAPLEVEGIDATGAWPGSGWVNLGCGGGGCDDAACADVRCAEPAAASSSSPTPVDRTLLNFSPKMKEHAEQYVGRFFKTKGGLIMRWTGKSATIVCQRCYSDTTVGNILAASYNAVQDGPRRLCADHACEAGTHRREQPTAPPVTERVHGTVYNSKKYGPRKWLAWEGRWACPHGQSKSTCVACDGGAICVHKIRRSRCTEVSCAGGGAMCQHNRERSHCRDPLCGGGGSFCKHDKLRCTCPDPDCGGGGSLCEHGIARSSCPDAECAGGGALCLHGNPKNRCQEEECGGSDLCRDCKPGEKLKPHHPDEQGVNWRLCAEHAFRAGTKAKFCPGASMEACECWDRLAEWSGVPLTNHVHFTPGAAAPTGREATGLIPGRQLKPDAYIAPNQPIHLAGETSGRKGAVYLYHGEEYHGGWPTGHAREGRLNWYGVPYETLYKLTLESHALYKAEGYRVFVVWRLDYLTTTRARTPAHVRDVVREV